jgi:hypothetical protein
MGERFEGCAAIVSVTNDEWGHGIYDLRYTIYARLGGAERWEGRMHEGINRKILRQKNGCWALPGERVHFVRLKAIPRPS